MKLTKHNIISNKSQLDELISNCKLTKYCSFDFETTGNRPELEEQYPTIVSISYQPGSSIVVPLGHFESPWKNSWKKILKYLSDNLFQDPTVIKIAQNAKFEHRWLLREFLNMRGRVFDTMLAKYLLNEEKPHGLKEMVAMLFPDFSGYDDEVSDLVRRHGWAGVPIKPLSKYCAIDSDLTLRIFILLERKLIKHNFYQLFRNMLMMAHRVLLETELRGMDINAPYLYNLDELYLEKLNGLEDRFRNHRTLVKYEAIRKKERKRELIQSTLFEIEEIKEELEVAKRQGNTKVVNSTNRKIASRENKVTKYIAGEFTTKNEKKVLETLNPDSPKQLIEFMYNHKRGLNCDILDYTESGNPSTAEDTLLKLLEIAKTEGNKKVIKFINNLLEWRSVATLHGTFIKGMIERLTPDSTIHCSYLIHGTVTGRLSSKNPNLQNIPRGTTSKDIKQMFIPPKGYIFLEIDYSQAELRVVAEISKDKAMIDIFKQGYNIHLATGLKMAGKFNDENYKIANAARKDPDHPENIYWTKLHKRGKSTNFSMLYGQSDPQLAEGLGVTIKEAGEFKQAWFSQFPGVTKWIRKQHRYAEKHGYVYSLWGRKRRLPDATRKGESNAYGFYAKALRDAVNAPIQGASNDFTIFSSILIREMKLRGELPWDLHQCYTVHDSLGYWIQPKDLKDVIPKLINICKNPETKKWFNFQTKYVNMKVSPEVGKNSWGDLQEYHEDFDYTQWIKDKDYIHN